MAQAVVDGNSHFYVTLEGDDAIYDFALPAMLPIVTYQVGDEVEFSYAEGEASNPVTSFGDATATGTAFEDAEAGEEGEPAAEATGADEATDPAAETDGAEAQGRALGEERRDRGGRCLCDAGPLACRGLCALVPCMPTPRAPVPCMPAHCASKPAIFSRFAPGG